jgi:hypothetical protein
MLIINLILAHNFTLSCKLKHFDQNDDGNKLMTMCTIAAIRLILYSYHSSIVWKHFPEIVMSGDVSLTVLIEYLYTIKDKVLESM